MLRVDEDYTLFAWDAFSPTESILASSPSEFETFKPVLDLLSAELWYTDHVVFRREELMKTCFSVFPRPEDHLPPQLTSRGCRISLPIFRHEEKALYGCLARLKDTPYESTCLCIMLRRVEGNEHIYERDWDVLGERSTLVLVPMSALKAFEYASIYVTTSTEFAHTHASASGWFRQSGDSMLRVEVDPRLCSQISRISSDRDDARLLPTEGAHTAGIIKPLIHYYSGQEYDDFYFQFSLSVGLVLIVVVRVDVNINPGLTARIEHVLKSSQSWLAPKWQLRPDCPLDRATLRAQDPTEGKDHGWYIHLSIRRAGSTELPRNTKRWSLGRNTKQYVLKLTKTRL